MSFTLPSLPYSEGALADRGMCQETLELHHGKHHKAYVDKLNGFVDQNDELKGKSLEEIIKWSADDASRSGVFNNAGQHWNHIHFWQALSPKGGQMPDGLKSKIEQDFGSVDAFRESFAADAASQFGSGWAWLIVADDGKLKTTKTKDGSNPIATGEGTPILGLDVWEHAYYLDFRNSRPGYVSNFLDNLANYEFAEENLNKA